MECSISPCLHDVNQAESAAGTLDAMYVGRNLENVTQTNIAVISAASLKEIHLSSGSGGDEMNKNCLHFLYHNGPGQHENPLQRHRNHSDLPSLPLLYPL
jgi:hypothetical protein